MPIDPLNAAHRAAITALHQLLLAALAHPTGSPERDDLAGAAEDVALMLEAYAHLWTPAG